MPLDRLISFLAFAIGIVGIIPISVGFYKCRQELEANQPTSRRNMLIMLTGQVLFLLSGVLMAIGWAMDNIF